MARKSSKKPIPFHLDGAPECSSRVIVGPEKAWLPDSLGRGERRAGLAVSLYGIHGARTWGCGDFTALRGVIDWVALRLDGRLGSLSGGN